MPYSVSMEKDELIIRVADWKSEENDIINVRTQVFVKEQNVPEELERDGKDPSMIHILAFYKGSAVGTARMSMDGHIGRVAVLKQMRGQSIGALMMKELENQAVLHSMDHVHLNAQIHARGFYESRGYKVEGDVFMEAGIPHIHMNKNIVKSI